MCCVEHVIVKHPLAAHVYGIVVPSGFGCPIVACLLVFLGTQLGVGSAMTTAVVVVLGIRIFSNTASIRRLLLKA